MDIYPTDVDARGRFLSPVARFCCQKQRLLVIFERLLRLAKVIVNQTDIAERRRLAALISPLFF